MKIQTEGYVAVLQVVAVYLMVRTFTCLPKNVPVTTSHNIRTLPSGVVSPVRN